MDYQHNYPASSSKHVFLLRRKRLRAPMHGRTVSMDIHTHHSKSSIDLHPSNACSICSLVIWSTLLHAGEDRIVAHLCVAEDSTLR